MRKGSMVLLLYILYNQAKIPLHGGCLTTLQATKQHLKTSSHVPRDVCPVIY